MKKHFYFLTAVGSDKPGLVARVTGVLFAHGCNLEDSAMMRLGSEFGMFAIFTTMTPLPVKKILRSPAFAGLTVDVEAISLKAASFVKSQKELWMVRVHGADRTGLVYHVTKTLAAHRFNITDLATHRTIAGPVPGYLLLIEGEPARASMKKLAAALHALAAKLDTQISFEPVASTTL